MVKGTMNLEEARNVRKTCRVEDPKRLPAEYKSTATPIIILKVIILKRMVGKKAVKVCNGFSQVTIKPDVRLLRIQCCTFGFHKVQKYLTNR